jgi:hypothetical protein
MASSGTYNFAPSNGELVLSAYERIQIRAPEIRQEHMFTAHRELNYMFSSWSNMTPNLWEVIRTQTTLVKGTATYSIPPQFIMILDASIVLNFGLANESRRYITPISRTEYLSFSNQQVLGPPTVFWFDRLISPTVTFWPVPDQNSTYTFDWYGCTQQFDANLAGGETPDIPYRWIDALVAGLAHRLSRVYAPQLEQQRSADADKAWEAAAAQDTENVGFMLAPGLAQYYRR